VTLKAGLGVTQGHRKL